MTDQPSVEELFCALLYLLSRHAREPSSASVGSGWPPNTALPGLERPPAATRTSRLTSAGFAHLKGAINHIDFGSSVPERSKTNV